MQLSPLSADLFAANVPPADGAGIASAAAPFADWLSAQTKSAPALAEPSAPPPFSQLPLNWGFPVASPAPTELPAANADADLLLTAGAPVEALPLQTPAALPKWATASMLALAEGVTTLPAESNPQSLQLTLSKREETEAVLRQPSTSQAPAAAKDQPVVPALAQELPVTESLRAPAETPGAVAGRPRRSIPSVEASPPELTTAVSSEPQFDPSVSVPQAVAPPVVSAEPALAPDPLPPLRPAGLAADPGLPPAFAASRPQPEASTPVQAEPERAALSPSRAPDPLLTAGVTRPEADPSHPVLAARSSQPATPNPQGLPWQGAQASVPGPEPTLAPGLPKPEMPSMQSTQPTLGPPVSKPVQAAVVVGVAPAVVPVAHERSAVAAMVTGAAPQVLAAGAGVLAGLVPPPAVGNVPVGPRQSTVSRPSPLWTTATPLETGAAEGLFPSPVTELSLTASRPVDAVAAGQPSRTRSLSDQRFADLFAAPSAPAQAAAPQLTRVATAAGPETEIQLTSDRVQPSLPLEGAPTPLVTTPIGQPAAPQAPAAAAAPLLTLPSGLQVPEQEVLQQVFGQLSARNLSGPQRITLRLNPEELGEVRLELIVDKETVRAHLQAQSQQVQEVLEKYLPRLREAFEQQGLKLQELQVTVDSGRDGGRGFFSQSQHQQQTPNFAPSTAPRRNLGDSAAEPVVPLPAATTRSGGGLSLRI